MIMLLTDGGTDDAEKVFNERNFKRPDEVGYRYILWTAKKKKKEMIFQFEVVMCYKHVFILKKTKNGNYLT